MARKRFDPDVSTSLSGGGVILVIVLCFNIIKILSFVCVPVDVRQEMLEEAQKKLMNLLNSTEGKIDKLVIS